MLAATERIDDFQELEKGQQEFVSDIFQKLKERMKQERVERLNDCKELRQAQAQLQSQLHEQKSQLREQSMKLSALQERVSNIEQMLPRY